MIESHYFDVNIQSLVKVPLLQRYICLIVTVLFLFLDPAWASVSTILIINYFNNLLMNNNCNSNTHFSSNLLLTNVYPVVVIVYPSPRICKGLI